MLTALHGLPLVEPLYDIGQAFPRLRVLMLRHADHPERLVVNTKLLPAGLEELTFTHVVEMDKWHLSAHSPLVCGLSRLQRLRRIIFAGAYGWPSRRSEDAEGLPEQLHLPPRVQVMDRQSSLCAARDPAHVTLHGAH